jgi:putative tryptophan/tyrosine transport system substrate-binding protein
MRAYRPLRRVGLIYNTDELNARLKAEELRALAVEEGLELVELRIEPGADGKPSPEAIAPKVEEAAGEGVDFLYVASSSFLMAERDRLTAAALAAGLPLASAYEAMVVESPSPPATTTSAVSRAFRPSRSSSTAPIRRPCRSAASTASPTW